MAEGLSETTLARLSEFVAGQLGLHFPRERWRDLERGVLQAAREFDIRDAESCFAWLTARPLTQPQIEILASYLTVGETYFFRDRRAFQLLEEEILPTLIERRRKEDRRLRIWSAGCATGEEPFSLAILLDRLIPDLDRWNLTLLATDINPRFLRKAEEGIYGSWSFQDCPPWIRETCFERLGDGKFRVVPRIRERVNFTCLNLAEDAHPSLLTNTNAMDIVLCRNVLMYFSFEPARRAVEKLYRSLVEGGWLFVSPSETSQQLFSQFAAVPFPGATLYRRDSRKAVPAVGLSPAEIQPLEPVSAFEEEPITALEATALPGGEVTEPSSAETAREEPGEDARRLADHDAHCLYERGRYGEVADRLLSWLAERSADSGAMTLLARAYANQGRLGEARVWCEKAIALDRLRPALHFLRATILLEQGDDAEAATSLRHALYLDQDFILAHIALANLRRRQERAGEALKHFENALSLLRHHRTDQLVPEADGMTAARLAEIIQSAVWPIRPLARDR